MVFSFTEAKVLGNWTGFSTKLYSSLFTGGMHHSLTSAIWNTFAIAMLAATASTALGSIAAIGIFNLRTRTRRVDVYKRQPLRSYTPMMRAGVSEAMRRASPNGIPALTIVRTSTSMVAILPANEERSASLHTPSSMM